MEHVVLVIHLILAFAMIVLILLQRSEGGGLGLGAGGGGLGNFASAQSTANALTKATTFVAVGFFTTSIVLAILVSRSGSSGSILDAVADQSTPAAVVKEIVPDVPVSDDGTSQEVPEPEAVPNEPPAVPIAK
ncbi:MAG: preprotein translocase subunit SecG [Alphaproteobacteria bacterium]|jgi:preprotein translocase subunit SecG|nr:preprotein translocase subunit SecG [Alphaproteobacteria bacterium]MCB1550960.1 preprotein translocase subunit SecG [Alphaproteobacteria bacterium]MCB9984861.1 preprotein translocase subunit SecG [Micavibrio sp.]HPQ50228.1 preprotein translocase subunit SecG [Alphaproteobacteria bacterium]HRK97253.1 preprotein translocase subunit SecG [Alphaproteobacteria bacterium]